MIIICDTIWLIHIGPGTRGDSSDPHSTVYQFVVKYSDSTSLVGEIVRSSNMTVGGNGG